MKKFVSAIAVAMLSLLLAVQATANPWPVIVKFAAPIVKGIGEALAKHTVVNLAKNAVNEVIDNFARRADELVNKAEAASKNVIQAAGDEYSKQLQKTKAAVHELLDEAAKKGREFADYFFEKVANERKAFFDDLEALRLKVELTFERQLPNVQRALTLPVREAGALGHELAERLPPAPAARRSPSRLRAATSSALTASSMCRAASSRRR